jgi:glycerophosphoryl diester phosphodiesterase
MVAMPRIWSHRGNLEGSMLPENTMGAIEAAIAAGVDGVEIDVWRAQDGRFVLSHDRIVDGVAIDHAPERILRLLPRLEDVLEAAAEVLLDVELKVPPDASDAEAVRLAGILADQVGARGNVVVSSFDLRAVRGLLAEGTSAGLIVEEPVGATQLGALIDQGLEWLFVDEALLASARSARWSSALRLGAWTVNDAAGLERAARVGCEVLITDRPRHLLELTQGEQIPATAPSASHPAGMQARRGDSRAFVSEDEATS